MYSAAKQKDNMTGGTHQLEGAHEWTHNSFTTSGGIVGLHPSSVLAQPRCATSILHTTTFALQMSLWLRHELEG
jgi:hypothetical protein